MLTWRDYLNSIVKGYKRGIMTQEEAKHLIVDEFNYYPDKEAHAGLYFIACMVQVS